jgi:hypothetical protein
LLCERNSEANTEGAGALIQGWRHFCQSGALYRQKYRRTRLKPGRFFLQSACQQLELESRSIPKISFTRDRLVRSFGLPSSRMSHRVKSFMVTVCSTGMSVTQTFTGFNPSGMPATHSLPRSEASARACFFKRPNRTPSGPLPTYLVPFAPQPPEERERLSQCQTAASM